MQSLTYTTWRKNSWHRYDMKKLRHCQPMYMLALLVPFCFVLNKLLDFHGFSVPACRSWVYTDTFHAVCNFARFVFSSVNCRLLLWQSLVSLEPVTNDVTIVHINILNVSLGRFKFILILILPVILSRINTWQLYGNSGVPFAEWNAF